MIQLWSALSLRKKKRNHPTRVIKDTPTLHRSMLFFGPGRTIPAMPWPIRYAPKAIPVRGIPLTCGPIQPLTSMMMRFCIPARFKFPR